MEKVSSCEDFEQVGLTMREWVLECKEKYGQAPQDASQIKSFHVNHPRLKSWACSGLTYRHCYRTAITIGRLNFGPARAVMPPGSRSLFRLHLRQAVVVL
jgi:hypothetical protein